MSFNCILFSIFFVLLTQYLNKLEDLFFPSQFIERVHIKRRLAELRLNTLTLNVPPEGTLLVNRIHIYLYVAYQVSVAADMK